MAIGAIDALSQVPGILLELGFLPVAILAKQPGSLLMINLLLHHTRMGVVAGEAVKQLVLAL